MSPQSNLKLPRFVKALLDILFGLLVFACAALALLILLSPMIVTARGIPFTASIPVGLGSGEDHRFEVQVVDADARGIRGASVSEAQGILRLETDNWQYISISYLAQFLVLLGLTYIFYLLRAALRDILGGDPFSPQNSARIHRIGTMVLLLAFLQPAIQYGTARAILSGLHIQPAVSLPSPFDAGDLLAGLLILILAQVWSYGLELKRDQALTV